MPAVTLRLGVHIRGLEWLHKQAGGELPEYLAPRLGRTRDIVNVQNLVVFGITEVHQFAERRLLLPRQWQPLLVANHRFPCEKTPAFQLVNKILHRVFNGEDVVQVRSLKEFERRNVWAKLPTNRTWAFWCWLLLVFLLDIYSSARVGIVKTNRHPSQGHGK